MISKLDRKSWIITFSYTGPSASRDRAGSHGKPASEYLSRLKLQVKLKREYPNATLVSVVGPNQTDCFRVDRLSIADSISDHENLRLNLRVLALAGMWD